MYPRNECAIIIVYRHDQSAPVSVESFVKRFDGETECFDLWKEGESIEGIEISRHNKLDTKWWYEPGAPNEDMVQNHLT